MIGSAPEKLIGKELAEVVPLALSLFEQAPEQEIKTELEIGTTDKRYFDVLISPLHEHEEDNAVTGRLIMFRDITHRKENELRLLQLTQAVEQSPASVLITDLQGNIEYVIPALLL
jgi:PAS domain-containing protein